MFHVVAFDPIRIHVVGKRMARNGGKIAKHKGYDI